MEVLCWTCCSRIRKNCFEVTWLQYHEMVVLEPEGSGKGNTIITQHLKCVDFGLFKELVGILGVCPGGQRPMKVA